MTRLANTATATACASLAEVRQHIDRIDGEIVSLIAERGTYVRQAAGFKKSIDEVPAPQRVAQVLEKVNLLALEAGADPNVVDATWRAMIAAFIDAERQTVSQAQASLHPPSPQPN